MHQDSCVPENTTVAVLYGGRSSERDISIQSGKAVAAALGEAGFSIVEIDTGVKGYMQTLEDSGCDVVFIALHGKGGEDGSVQGVCEELGLPYTGSGILASALAMDKVHSKIVYRDAGIPTPESAVLRTGDEWAVDQIVQRLGEKTVVKPANEGSSMGMSIVHRASELGDAIELAFEKDNEVLVEQFVEGAEVTVAVVGNDELKALPIIQIVPRNEFYDFDAKYAPGGSQHLCPAPIPDDQTARCTELSLAAHRALGCRGVSRSDFIIDAEGTPWILETNTIPGMTATSLIPDAARVDGVSFPELCAHLVNLALE